jgi:hypothetical protein
MDEMIHKKSLWELDDEEFEDLLHDPFAQEAMSLWIEIEAAATGVSLTEELVMEVTQFIGEATNKAANKAQTSSRRTAERQMRGVSSNLSKAISQLNGMQAPLIHALSENACVKLEDFQSFIEVASKLAAAAEGIAEDLNDPSVATSCQINLAGKGRPANISVDQFIKGVADIYAEAGGRPSASVRQKSQNIDGPFPRFLQVVLAPLLEWRHSTTGALQRALSAVSRRSFITFRGVGSCF